MRGPPVYSFLSKTYFSGCNGNGTIIPVECMGKATSVPKSLLKVKVWYDNGFLQATKIQTHAIAKNFIYATLAHVQHFMCSSTLGTILETEVCFRLNKRTLMQQLW
jgi:hypothetical protein